MIIMPGLKRRSSSKGRKPLLDSLAEGQIRRATTRSRVDFIYIDQSLGLPANMDHSKNADDFSDANQSSSKDGNCSNVKHTTHELNGINFTCNPGYVNKESVDKEVDQAVNSTIKDNYQIKGHRSRNSSGTSRTNESAIVKEHIVVQLPVVINESGADAKLKEQYNDVTPKVQMRDKKTRIHRVQADAHSNPSLRESWLEAEVFDFTKMNVVEHVLPRRNSDVFDKFEKEAVKVDNMPYSLTRKDSVKDRENVKSLKQQRKMLKRLLKYQSSRHAEASDDIKSRAEVLIENVKYKESFMLEKLQEKYEETAFEIIGQIEALDSEMASLVTKGGKRNSIVQAIIDKDSQNDSSEPDDVQSTISEETLNEDVSLSGINKNNNETPKRKIHKRKSQTKFRQLDENLMISQKFVAGGKEIDFGEAEFPKVSAEMLKKSKERKERRKAAGSSVSSDPRKSMLIETQLSVCQEGGCKLSWMLDRESRHRGPLLNVEGMSFTASGELVVAEHTVNKGRLQVFDRKGTSKTILGEGIIFPWNVTVTQNGEYAVTSCKTKSIQTVTEGGQMTEEWESDIFIYPSSIAFDNEEAQIYITDTETCKVTIHKPDGELVGKLRALQDGENVMGHPVAVATSPDGYVAVLDKTNHCVHLFDSAGIYLYNFGKNGSKDGYLKHPSGLAMDIKGNIYVADSHNNRVSKFSLQGMFMEHILTDEDAVLDPTCVAVSSSTGQLAVADMLGIKVFNIGI